MDGDREQRSGLQQEGNKEGISQLLVTPEALTNLVSAAVKEAMGSRVAADGVMSSRRLFETDEGGNGIEQTDNEERRRSLQDGEHKERRKRKKGSPYSPGIPNVLKPVEHGNTQTHDQAEDGIINNYKGVRLQLCCPLCQKHFDLLVEPLQPITSPPHHLSKRPRPTENPSPNTTGAKRHRIN
ncbi:hypothetical protein Salat_0370500 [Sesamum alatum]|uniref:Uncharacterized protein n=1 Tax=Sesamum alatum TaxID=300844 RepID=A0AAE1Z2U3_9LAMI|nr:hypothetical protein Salat_0370500 [Sesamum alatum]